MNDSTVKPKFDSKFFDRISDNLQKEKANSAWSRGVRLYADDLIQNLRDINEYKPLNFDNFTQLKQIMLNGATSWEAYSYGGCSLIFDYDIAKRLCTPSELKKNHDGDYAPNKNGSWLDVQARALYQASIIVYRLMKQATMNSTSKN